MRRLLVVSAALVAVSFAAWTVFVLTRPDDELVRADAVLVLAGNSKRLPVGVELVRQGVAPVLVLSEDTSGRDLARERLCAGGLPRIVVVCRRAVPYSTRGEARLLAALVRERGWRTVVVVTSRYHLLRARRILERCLGATRLLMHGAPTTVVQKATAVPLEAIKLVLASTLRRAC